jgi:2-isopropylmalate synthase
MHAACCRVYSLAASRYASARKQNRIAEPVMSLSKNRRSPQFLDTTLRDGELSSAFNPSPEQRALIATRIEAAGVPVIELACSADEDEFFARSKQIAGGLKTATPCCLSQSTPEHLQKALDFLAGLDRARIHLYLDRKRLQQIDSEPARAEEILAPVRHIIAEAGRAVAEVEFSLQDSTRFKAKTLIPAIEVALDAGARVIGIADTVGTATPESLRELLFDLYAAIPGLESRVLSLHAHNHEGRAVDNVLAALDCGVTQIEGTIGGVGPAGGNTDLVEAVTRLESRAGIDIGAVDSAALRAIAALEPFEKAG